jgi:hypothetical protein
MLAQEDEQALAHQASKVEVLARICGAQQDPQSDRFI